MFLINLSLHQMNTQLATQQRLLSKTEHTEGIITRLIRLQHREVFLIKSAVKYDRLELLGAEFDSSCGGQRFDAIGHANVNVDNLSFTLGTERLLMFLKRNVARKKLVHTNLSSLSRLLILVSETFIERSHDKSVLSQHQKLRGVVAICRHRLLHQTSNERFDLLLKRLSGMLSNIFGSKQLTRGSWPTFTILPGIGSVSVEDSFDEIDFLLCDRNLGQVTIAEVWVSLLKALNVTFASQLTLPLSRLSASKMLSIVEGFLLLISLLS